MSKLNAGLVYIVSSPEGSIVVYGSNLHGNLGGVVEDVVAKMASGDVVEVRAYTCEVSYEALRPPPPEGTVD